MLRIIPHIERAAHHIAHLLDRLPGLRVTQAEAHVLVFLAGRRAATVGEIHRTFGHKRSTLTSILDRLTERKLVVRTASEADRRSFVVRLTPAGSRIALRLRQYLERVERKLLRKMPASSIQGFLAVIEAFTCAPAGPRNGVRKAGRR